MGCVICSKRKFRTCELERTKFLLQAMTLFQDEVFSKIFDLNDEPSINAADLYCHKQCIIGWKIKFKNGMDDQLVSKQPKKCGVFWKYYIYKNHIWKWKWDLAVWIKRYVEPKQEKSI